MATGIDNTGLYEGRREAMGIIKAMAGQITSFDVFSGIGISAATAFASAAKSSYDFEKEFRKNMLEVATISTQVEGSMTDFMNQVMEITQQVPIKAPEAAKALYQIVSAGHDGAAGINVLEVAAKSAVGGITDTVTAADAITTLLNAYKLSADDAEKVSDQLFTTARLGKTTFGELGQSIAQVAPIAAAYGVEMDQVLAAVATLTKSGTPTAQAMTQIRASIIGTSKVLGDGAFNSMTFQEALAEIASRAGGSEAKLRELIPEVEAVNGVLGLTGIKAQDAAEHLNAMNESAGATEAAFNKMQEDVGNQMILISNNIQAALRPMGSAILKNVSEAAQMINKGFETGQIQSSMETLQKLLVAVAGAFVTYKSAAIGASTAEALHSAKVTISSNLKSLQSQITGEAALSKEKERIHLEAYTTSLEKSITEEQRAKLAKMDLKSGSQEYMKALSEQALQEKKNADNQVESLTKVVNKNKEKLSSAQENLEMSHQAVEAAQAELNAAIEANDSIGFEVAQTKMNAAAQREEAASVNVAAASKGVKASETRLVTVTTAAEAAATRVNTATTVADTAVTNIATTAKSRLKIATIALLGAMKANPLGAILTALSFVATAYMVLANRTDDLTTAQGRLKKNTDDFESSITSERVQIDILFGKLNAARKGTDDYRKAKEAILNKYGKYLEGLNEEVKSLENVSDAYKAISKAAVQAAKDRAIEKGTQDASDAYANDWKDNITQIREQFVDKFGELKGEELFYKLRQSLADGLDLTPELEKSISKFDKYIYNRSTGSNDNNNPVERLVKNIKISKRKLDDELEGINASFGELMKVSEEGGSDSEGGSTGKPIIEIASITKEIETATTKVSTLKQELTDLRSGKTSVEAGKTVKEVIEGKVKDLKAAEDALSTLTGKDTASDKKSSDEQKKALETRKKLNEELLSLRMQNQQAEINLMAEGRDKRLAQIEFDYDSEIAVILAKEKEWKEAQGGKLTGDQTKEVQTSFLHAYVKKEKSSALVDKDQLEAEKQAMNEYLAAYGNYQEKRKAITEKYSDLIAKEPTKGGKLSLGKDMERELDAVDDLYLNSTMNRVTMEEDAAYKILELKQDQFVTDSVYQLKRNALEKKFAQQKMSILKSTNTQEGTERHKQIENEKKQLAGHLEYLDGYGEKLKGEIIQDALSGLSDIAGAIGGLNDDLGETMNNLQQVIGAVAQLASGNYIGAAVSVITSVVSSIAKRNQEAIAAAKKAEGDYWDAVNWKIERQIELMKELEGISSGQVQESIQNQINELVGVLKGIDLDVKLNEGDGIEGFMKLIDKGIESAKNKGNKFAEEFLSGFYEEGKGDIDGRWNFRFYDVLKDLSQDEIISLQGIPEIWQILPEEIQNYIKQLSEAIDKQEGLTEATKEMFTGTTEDDIVQSILDAMDRGKDGVDDLATYFKDMMKKAMLEGVKMNYLQKPIQDFYKQFSAMTESDGMLTEGEIDQLESMYEQIVNNAQGQFDNLQKISGLDFTTPEEKGVSGQLQAAMTEGTASQLVGLWNSTAIDTRELKNLTIEQRDSVKSVMADVKEIVKQNYLIEQNTRRGADNTDGLIDELKIGFETLDKRLGTIEKNTKSYNGRG